MGQKDIEELYKNNSYLMDDSQMLEEILFFERYGKQTEQDGAFSGQDEKDDQSKDL